MVFYFTATGNSLYVAKQFDPSPVSIPQAIHSASLRYEDSEIGFVAPIYAGELPKIVVDFIRKGSFKAPYIYLILTYGMNDSVGCEWSFRTAAKAGLHISYIHTIRMVDNYLPAFDMNKQRAMEKHVDEQIASAVKKMAEHAVGIPRPSVAGRAAYIIVKNQNPRVNNGSQITVTDRCDGCGVCSKVCPLGRFYVEDGYAMRREETCLFCLACAHACPRKAITMSISDKNPNARYRNEHISLEEIIAANCQIRE